MTKFFSWEIQQKLTSYLKEQGLCGGRIYDMPPPQPKFPYVVIGEDQLKSNDTKTSRGFEFKLLLHIFSNLQGRAEVKVLTQEMLDKLKDYRFEFDDHHVVHVDLESIQTYQDEATHTSQSLTKLNMLGSEKKQRGAA